MYHNWA